MDEISMSHLGSTLCRGEYRLALLQCLVVVNSLLAEAADLKRLTAVNTFVSPWALKCLSSAIYIYT